MASLPKDESFGCKRRLRYLLLSADRPGLYSIRAGRAIFLGPNHHRTTERGRVISRTLCTTISYSDLISNVCTLFADHEFLGQCSSPQFSASNGPTIFTKRPGRISQRFVAGGRIRRRPGNTSATLPLPESSAGRISTESNQGYHFEHVGQYWIAGSHSRNTSRFPPRGGIGWELLV